MPLEEVPLVSCLRLLGAEKPVISPDETKPSGNSRCLVADMPGPCTRLLEELSDLRIFASMCVGGLFVLWVSVRCRHQTGEWR